MLLEPGCFPAQRDLPQTNRSGLKFHDGGDPEVATTSPYPKAKSGVPKPRHLGATLLNPIRADTMTVTTKSNNRLVGIQVRDPVSQSLHIRQLIVVAIIADNRIPVLFTAFLCPFQPLSFTFHHTAPVISTESRMLLVSVLHQLQPIIGHGPCTILIGSHPTPSLSPNPGPSTIGPASRHFANRSRAPTSFPFSKPLRNSLR